MAYPPPQGGYSYPPTQSSQPGYPPPHGQYPPQGHSPYPPQQQGFAPPPLGQYPPQSHSPQPYGYPQQQYNQPPQGYAPQQQPYGAPPGPYPPQQAPYGDPNQAAYGANQAYSATPPTPLSPGYDPRYLPPVDPQAAEGLRAAMKGTGTNEAVLIRILAQYPAPLILSLKNTYFSRIRRSLESDIKSETSSYFQLALLSILRGPLYEDVFLLDRALKGAGTNEALLNDVLIGRSNADLNAIKQAYHSTYNRSLEKDVSNDLSAKTDRLFAMILAATRQEDSAPVIPQAIDADVLELHRATEAKIGTDQLTVCSILSNRSDGQIRAISHAYQAKYRTSLEKVVAKEFSGHMEAALIQIVRKGCDPAMRDAMLLEDSMKGFGTKDELLVSRVVRCHWDKGHLGQVKGAYRMKYGKELSARIKGETSGDYQRMLVAMIE